MWPFNLDYESCDHDWEKVSGPQVADGTYDAGRQLIEVEDGCVKLIWRVEKAVTEECQKCGKEEKSLAEVTKFKTALEEVDDY